MKKFLTTSVLIVAMVASGCATASNSNSDYVVKVNGVETNTERAKKPNYLIPALIIGAGIVAGVALTSGGSDNDTGADDRAEQFRNCLAAGFPEDYCRRTVYGT